jgi:hypothetical protein
LEYKAYLKSASGRLEADDYLVETGVKIPGYEVDLYAFKDTTEMSISASSHKQVACFIEQVAVASGEIVADYCKSVLSYENDRRGAIVNVMKQKGVQPTRLILPVIVSRYVRDDAIAFVKSYNPFSWQLYQHPVIVNLETGAVHRHIESTLYGAAYMRLLNRVVNENIAPK